MAVAKADEKVAHLEIIKQKGFKLVGNTVVATEEADVERALKQLKTHYTTLLEARKRLTFVENAVEANRAAIKQLIIRRTQLGQQMQSANLNTASRNALTVQYNSITDQINSRMEADQNGDDVAKAKELYATPRNAYLKAIIALRDLIDKTDAKYKTAGGDASLEAAITAAGTAESKKLTFGPTKTYLQLVKTFASYEATIMTDSIPLDRQSGTYRIDVILNGKDPVKMVFDTGASMISLSHEMATKAGLKSNDPSTEVTITIANGQKVKGRMMKLASVRVGKFEVKNVDCVVMPADLPDSPALLGGAFLNNFKYEVDADAKKLRLYRIDSGNNKSPGK